VQSLGTSPPRALTSLPQSHPFEDRPYLILAESLRTFASESPFCGGLRLCPHGDFFFAPLRRQAYTSSWKGIRRLILRERESLRSWTPPLNVKKTSRSPSRASGKDILSFVKNRPIGAASPPTQMEHKLGEGAPARIENPTYHSPLRLAFFQPQPDVPSGTRDP